MINLGKKVVVFQDDTWSFDGSPVDLVNYINEKASDIPEDHIKSAVVEIKDVCSYGESWITFEMYYRRPLTEEEMKIQNDKDAQLKKLRIEQKIRNFNKLRQELEREGLLL